ncbi:uncharacterized protein LOC107419150 [Ziziphus jujuba]|uniref:Uncharacterized protein LOC107419150 n=1 Tax=Ziziphus jujuba TaxID=326968 RepID=A0A6P3ZTP3_ZIZJJ|nr:uncharacterized protein LOC107419150 [Ziziphus jujuba]
MGSLRPATRWVFQFSFCESLSVTLSPNAPSMDSTTRLTPLPPDQLNPITNPNPSSNNLPSNPHSQMFNPTQFTFSNSSSQLSHHSSTTTNHTANPFLSFPQPVLPYTLPSDPPIHPPGTDPYANSGTYPLTHVGFHGQTQYREDPNASFQNWVVNQAESIRYDNVVKSDNENSLVPTSSNSYGNNTWTHQPLANDVTNNTLSQSSVNGQVIAGSLGVVVPTSAELAKKTRKLVSGGTAVDSVRLCTICDVVCNSQDVYNKHISGRKHAAQVSLAALGDIGPYFAAVRSQFSSTGSKVPKKVKVIQSAWCDVCKINCNSNDVYVKHLTGKKHLKNLEQLKKLSNASNAAASIGSSAGSIPVIGPPENPQTNKGKSVDTPKPHENATQSQAVKEDLEMKRRKIVESGTAAHSVRMCTICNVACNSQTVLDSHLGGQKHKDMMNKLAKAGMATAG